MNGMYSWRRKGSGERGFTREVLAALAHEHMKYSCCKQACPLCKDLTAGNPGQNPLIMDSLQKGIVSDFQTEDSHDYLS